MPLVLFGREVLIYDATETAVDVIDSLHGRKKTKEKTDESVKVSRIIDNIYFSVH